MEQPIKFESWAIVEIMGHTKVAGMCQTQNFGNTVMLRVDIPETDNHPAHTKMYGMSSIFSISPVDQETATAHANVFNVSPIVAYEVELSIRKKALARAEQEIALRLNPAPVEQEHVWSPDEDDDDFEEEEYDYHGNQV